MDMLDPPLPEKKSEMANQTREPRFVPENEYEHANELTNSEQENDEDVLDNFSKIVDKHIQLGNLGNDMVMRLYQNDENSIAHLLSMCIRDEELKPYAKFIYHSWRGEILITKAKDNLERRLQAQVGTKYVTRENTGGYGNTYPELFPKDQGKPESIIDKFLNRGKNNNNQGGMR